jgi:hypothetical protein
MRIMTPNIGQARQLRYQQFEVETNIRQCLNLDVNTPPVLDSSILTDATDVPSWFRMLQSEKGEYLLGGRPSQCRIMNKNSSLLSSMSFLISYLHFSAKAQKKVNSK